MRLHSYARRTGIALLSMLSTLTVGGRASADQVIDSFYLNGSYNPTTINFTYGSSNTAESVSGGGVAGGSLTPNGSTAISVPSIYCLQWSIDVVVPGTYGQTLVNSDGVIHDPSQQYNVNDGLVDQPGATSPRVTSSAPALNIAWLMANLSYDASQGIDPLVNSSSPSLTALNAEAGLQAAIWAQVTPGFVLTSTGQIATAFNDYNKLLQAAQNVPGGLANDVSQVLFISPSTNAEAGSNPNVNQALVGYMGPQSNPFVAAPEPATFAMALSGLVPFGLVALARRRRRAATSA